MAHLDDYAAILGCLNEKQDPSFMGFERLTTDDQRRSFLRGLFPETTAGSLGSENPLSPTQSPTENLILTEAEKDIICKQRKLKSLTQPALQGKWCGETRSLPWWSPTAGWCSAFILVIVSLFFFLPKINAKNDIAAWKEFWNFVCASAFEHSFEAAFSSCGIVATVFFLRWQLWDVQGSAAQGGSTPTQDNPSS